MSERALAKGSALVAPVAQLMRIYSMRLCPYAQRTRLVLAHKHIPNEVINVNLKHKPDWLLARNPAGLVPVLEYQDKIVYESTICDEFLEEEFPDTIRLMPESSFEKSRARLLMYLFDKDVRSFYGLLSRKEGKRETSLKQIDKMLKYFEDELRASNAKFFGGDQCGMVDFHIWPWFERLDAFGQLAGGDFMPAKTFPQLTEWMKRMHTVEAVKETRLPTDWHMQFFVSLAQRDPQYDIGLDSVAKL